MTLLHVAGSIYHLVKNVFCCCWKRKTFNSTLEWGQGYKNLMEVNRGITVLGNVIWGCELLVLCSEIEFYSYTSIIDFTRAVQEVCRQSLLAQKIMCIYRHAGGIQPICILSLVLMQQHL